MNITDIKNLSRNEKLILMEALWEELSCEEESLDSPAWHANELSKTKSKVNDGVETIHEWPEAKKFLRNKFE